MTMHKFLYKEHLPGGASWSARLRRGQGLRIQDPTGEANLVLGLWSAADPLERFCLPDTLKSQRIARLSAPCTLQSDMGRALVSLVADTCGWHDVLGGLGDYERAVARFGETTYQDHRNDRLTNARDHFLVELGKYGLGERDLVSVVNLFSRVSVDAAGALHWDPKPQLGRAVTLRMEMETLVVLSATPHPLDPSRTWTPRGLDMEVVLLPVSDPDDPVRTSCPENARALELSERLYPGQWP
ncbi:MAG: DUF1989 domain-containing protein [Fibrobacteres bacterium]|nr:DUF1989 domain-containing protein [Fibrobacterota bacterium]